MQSQPQMADAAARTAIARVGFQLTGDLELLGWSSESGRDRMLAFAVRMPRNRVERFLRDARFDAPLVAGRRVFQAPVAGIDTAGAAEVASAQDSLTIDGSTYTRSVMALFEGQDQAIVHVWAFTT